MEDRLDDWSEKAETDMTSIEIQGAAPIITVVIPAFNRAQVIGRARAGLEKLDSDISDKAALN